MDAYMKSLRGVFVVLMALFCLHVGAFPLNVKGIDSLNTAILIHDLRFGVDIVAENIDRPLVPASVMKSVTMAALLNLADLRECFVTPVVVDGFVADSVLNGNIVVLASGDPTIESQFFESTVGFADSICAAVMNLGIKRVVGDVVIDESHFPDATVPPGWMTEDLLWPYGTRLHGANFRDNRFKLSLPSKKSDPYVPDLNFSIVSTKSRGVKVDRKDGSETFTIRGNVRRGFSDNFATPYPSKVMRHEILTKLADNNIEVSTGPVMAKSTTPILIYEHRSPSFGEIMRSLMFRSDNLMAEGMLRALTPEASRAEALREEMAIWTLAGINTYGIRISDGSGLSRQNRLTARFLADVYRYMLPVYGEDYYSLFPRAGYDGTMKNFLVGTELEKRVAMKTGSMKGVQSYAGFLLDEDGRPTHLIVFIVNNFSCSRAVLKKEIERLLLEKFAVSLQNGSRTYGVDEAENADNDITQTEE